MNTNSSKAGTIIKSWASSLGAVGILGSLASGGIFQKVSGSSYYSYEEYNTELVAIGIVSSLILWIVIYAFGMIICELQETNQHLRKVFETRQSEEVESTNIED